MTYALTLYFLLLNADGSIHSTPESVARYQTPERCARALNEWKLASSDSRGRWKVTGSCTYDPNQEISARWM